VLRLRNIYCYLLWEVLPNNEQKKKTALLGVKYAKETVNNFSDDPDGYLWRGIFLGIYGMSNGIMNSLFITKDMRESLEKAYKLDKTYLYGMSPLILGRLYSAIPTFPVSFGNLKKGERYLKEAFSIDPNYAHSPLFLAALYGYKGEISTRDYYLDLIKKIQPKTWLQKIIKIWTVREIPVLKKKLIKHYNRYTYDPLLEPARHNR